MGLKELAKLSEHGRRRGYTHYEYAVSSSDTGDIHHVLGVLEDTTGVEIISLTDESRAKAIVNLLNSDLGWHEDREDIGEIDG